MRFKTDADAAAVYTIYRKSAKTKIGLHLITGVTRIISEIRLRGKISRVWVDLIDLRELISLSTAAGGRILLTSTAGDKIGFSFKCRLPVFVDKVLA